MSEQLTILLNGKEYALNDDLKEGIEKRAENEFDENWLLEYHWGSNERGDPILYIETEGPKVPWDRLEKLEFEMAPTEESPDGEGGDSGQTDDLDNGNGVKSVPKDDVDMDAPDADPASGEGEPDEPDADNKFMVTHPQKNYVPQPEDEDPEKIPAHPEELPEDPMLVTWIPDDEREEVWSTGRAIAPVSVFLEWNLQLKADEAPENATTIEPGPDGHVQEVPKTHNHEEWERMVEMSGCEVVAEKKKKQSTPTDEQQRGYSGKEADDDMGGIAGGNNWNFGN